MINHEVVHKTSAETNTQVASYFDIVDNALKMSDTNKRYTPTMNACYATSCPVQSGSFTTVIISPTGDNTADIYNGYIYAEMNLGFTLSGTALTPVNPHEEFSTVWFGFKDSMDAIEKYEILANGQTIYSQNNAIEESFITNCASTDTIRRSDIYSKVRHKDIWKRRKGNQCGVFIDWALGYSQILNATIKLKIDLRKFLPLSNIKYLPAFAGKVELKLYFSTAGMVCANVDPLYRWNNDNAMKCKLSPPEIACEFVQLGDDFLMVTGYTKATVDDNGAVTALPTWTAGTRVLTANRDYKITSCQTVIPCFGIHQPIYDELVTRYSQSALTFPTQTLQVNSMSNILSTTSAKSTLTITPRFIDTIFFLFPIRANSRTVYKNPGFTTFQLSCAGYGNIPASAFGTVWEPRLIEMCSQALKLNTDTFGMCDEVLRSLTDGDAQAKKGIYSSDRTDFFIGIPTETDNTFQQGQTSNSPINYELAITQSAGQYMNNVRMPPVMCLLMDATFSIQVNANGQPPRVAVGSYDITSPVEG